ncbi:oligopeptide ABC transporter ATP-binding protein [Spiroplasma helicoides]|uniref:Oligopeptide ABC transporter ATP-binding protein n=1 Tax=Spiroplasma helicoides TaxID=216938 RepID=A0A1B3SKJ0_9MOLU|nr:oligopeptide ABC transporter ATP-binding protein OppF [Spiroplasma helicoides]AOG60454.1 oligopeptide ABC transporter ATP-binding protein [Spiroplasma helicoides]
MSNSKAENFLNVRDLVIEFRNRGKKFQAVKGANFDIFKGEIFGLVGESGSGKTTIGRAIVGVQPLKDGSVFLENNLVAGKPTSLYTLNKEIYKRLKNIDVKLSMTTSYINNLIKDLKKVYENFSQSNSDIDAKQASKMLKKNKLTFVEDIVLNNLKYVNTIIKYFDRINKFTNGINEYNPEISVQLEKAIILKNNKTKESVMGIKESFEIIYKSISKVKSIIKKFNKKEETNISKLMIDVFSELKIAVAEQKTVLEEIKKTIQYEFQNLALSAPTTKRDKFKHYYWKMVYIDRDEFFLESKKQLEIELNNPSKNKELILKIQDFISDFWSKSNINLKSCEELLDYISNKDKKQNVNVSALLETLKNTHFENDLKKIINEQKVLSQKEIDDLNKEFKSIKKIVKQNIVKDEESIQYFYKWRNIEIDYSLESRESIIELCEFLELPSIDELVKSSYLFENQTRKQKRLNRKNIQMIFQDPGSSLNDRMAIEEIIAEGLENFTELFKSQEAMQRYINEHNEEFPDSMISFEDVKSKDVKKHIILKLISSVGLLPEHLSRYPHEFSGGQRQRVGIARSLAMRPKIIIADEPISALDVSIRAQVLNLFKKFKEEYDLTYLFITHDLSVVRFIADRIAVIYHGQIVELAEAEELFKNPLHQYTKSLLSAIPIPDPELSSKKDLVVYDAQKEHFDYDFDLPSFVEVKQGHYVHANKRELKIIKKSLI